MHAASSRDNSFVGYEYKDAIVRRQMESLVVDGYRNFGWILEGTTIPMANPGSLILKFKRDRGIRNKAELARLQRQFDACVDDILSLNSQKGLMASVAAYVAGVAGTLLMAGAVFACLAGLTPLMAMLAIPGIAGWVVPYPCYLTLRRKKTGEVEPLIDGKYDEIYAVCERANALLAEL